MPRPGSLFGLRYETEPTRLSGTEIGEMIGVDYSTVSQGRKRIREKLKHGKHLSQIIKRVEADLSLIKTPLVLLL